MPRLSLPILVVAFLLREGKAVSLDVLARVSVLEGIAGMKPGTWMKDTIPTREIVEVFGPGVKATWLSPRDSGLVTAVRRSLEPLLRNTSVTADDILQPAIVGLGSKGDLSRLPLFHGVGRAPGFTVAKVRSGQLQPRDVLPVAKSYARRRAIDVLRSEARKPGIMRVEPDELKPGDRSDLTDMITAVLVDPGHRLHGAVTRSLAGIIETKARPSNKKIWNALVAGVRDGMSASDVARELGISKAAVSQAKEAHRHHRQGRHRHEPEAARPAPGRARAWAAWPCPSWKGSAVEHVVGRGQVELEKFGDGLEAFDLREVEAHEHKCTSTRWGGPSCRWRTT